MTKTNVGVEQCYTSTATAPTSPSSVMVPAVGSFTVLAGDPQNL